MADPGTLCATEQFSISAKCSSPFYEIEEQKRTGFPSTLSPMTCGKVS